MGPKKRRKARAKQPVQTAAAAAKERDQDTARLINEALEHGIVGTLSLPVSSIATMLQFPVPKSYILQLRAALCPAPVGRQHYLPFKPCFGCCCRMWHGSASWQQ